MDAVDLYWIPVGAGGWFVRRSAGLYEVWAAARCHRGRQSLFHSALLVTVGNRAHVIEMAPVWNLRVPDRGVVAGGPVGDVRLGRWQAFRYEVRCWPGGVIPDAAEAVGSPLTLSSEPTLAARIVDLAPQVPRLTWGRDELRAGDMWNSNSLISWLLTSVGVDAAALHPPGGGRAPGWDAGVRAGLAGLRGDPDPETDHHRPGDALEPLAQPGP